MSDVQVSTFIIGCIALVVGYAAGRFSGYDYGFRKGYVSGMRVTFGGKSAKTSD